MHVVMGINFVSFILAMERGRG